MEIHKRLTPSWPPAESRQRTGRCWQLASAALLVVALPLFAVADADFRDHPSVRRAFQDAVRPVRASTVRVFDDKRQVALGVIVDRQGLVITKGSELKGRRLICRTSDGQQYTARIVARDRELDLVLLRCRIGQDVQLQPVTWHAAKPPAVGSWLATPDAGRLPLAVGIVSVAARRIPHQPGFLGVGLAQTGEGPQINQVLENSAAAEAGLKLDDVVQRINDRQIRTRREMVTLIASMRPGDRIRVQIKRAAEEMQINVTLGTRDLNGSRTDRFTQMNTMGGPLSRRRAGFDSAIQHDTILQPHHCGGPVVDLDGNVVGINIARAARTHSYALPAKLVKRKVAQLKAKAALADKTKP
ncbi:MAG: PDZ domain-containing protein [Planctomycetota bacterium]|nr:PDZ domain-containing protein [Planctomycetota bacterium]